MGLFYLAERKAMMRTRFEKNAGKHFLDASLFAPRRGDAHGRASSIPLPAHHENKQDPPIIRRPFLFGREEDHSH